jgi:hypothetical protein
MKRWFKKSTADKFWFPDDVNPGDDFTDKIVETSGAVWDAELGEWSYVLPEGISVSEDDSYARLVALLDDLSKGVSI